MSKLTNLKGRINYISSQARQENLYAVYETTDRKVWPDLAKCNQEEFIKSGTEGKCIEARELIIALPESFTEYDPSKLLEVFTSHFKQHYGVECIAALHHNKRKTNYHIHLIFSERKLLAEPIEKVAARNMFYDEKGKHIRTKKEILDENGQLREGCKIIPKGEVYERQIFTKKDKRFKSENFLDEVKQSYTDLINVYVQDDKDKLKVFDRNGAYLPMKKIGKNNPKAPQIKSDNEQRAKWNQTVDWALVNDLPEEQITVVKKAEIGMKAKQSIEKSGNHPEQFAEIIKMAVMVLDMLITRFIQSIKKKEKPDNVMPEKTDTIAPVMSEKIKVEQLPKEKIPEKPQMPKRATLYLKFKSINQKLSVLNEKINERSAELRSLERELSECRGIFQGKKRKELQEQITKEQTQIENLKSQFPAIVQKYGFKNMKEFYASYRASYSDYTDYQKKREDWEYKYGTPKSVRARLQRITERKQQEKQRKNVSRKRDRDAR